MRTAALVACAVILSSPAASAGIGNFGARATPVAPQALAPGQFRQSRSPDGKSVAEARADSEGRSTFRTDGAIGQVRLDIGEGVGAEVLWSTDSRAMVVTASEGGVVGTYEATVVRASKGRPEVIELGPIVRRAFGNPVACYEPEAPNVGAVRWLKGSSTLLVAAEILPHSNCDSMGNFRAFIVDLDGRKVVGAFDQITTKRRYWQDLGQELRAADDNCARRPSDCWIPDLHPRR